MKKILIILSLIVFSLSPILANGTQEDSTSDQIKIRMSWWGGDARHKATLAAISQYEQDNPNVKIDAEYSGWDGYYQKLVTQIAGGTEADIMQIDQPWLVELSSKGEVFLPIDGKIDTSDFEQKFLNDFCVSDGILYGLPTGTNVATFLLDPDILESVGYDASKQLTWEDLITYGKKLHEQDSSKYFLNLQPDTFRRTFIQYLAQISGGFIDNNKQIVFSESQAKEAFDYMQSLLDNNVVQPFSQTSLYNKKTEEVPAWINKNVAVSPSWVSNLDMTIGQKTNIIVGLKPVMEGAKNTGVIARPSQLFVVSANSKHPEVVFDFLNKLFNDEKYIKILGVARGVPSTTNGRTILSQTGAISPMVAQATDLGLSQAGDPENSWCTNSEVIQTTQDVIDEFGFGQLNSTQAAQKLIQDLKNTLNSL